MEGEIPKTMRQSLSQVNPHLICGLCQGYLINATAITECLHTFCRPCIVQFLNEKKTCPLCGVLVHKTKPHLNLRPDKVLQDLVYKLVPGLFKREMQRRKEYNISKTKAGHDHTTSPKLVDPDGGGASLIYAEDDQMSLCIHHCESLPPFVRWGTNSRRQRPTTRQELVGDKRYLLCPAGMSIGHLKKFLRLKFDLQPKFEIELFHTDESLEDGYRLMDVAYICDWRMVAPLDLFYIVYDVTQKPMALPEVMREKAIVVRKERPERPVKVAAAPGGAKRKKRRPRQSLMTRRKNSKTRILPPKLPNETVTKLDEARDSGIPESPEQGGVSAPGAETPERSDNPAVVPAGVVPPTPPPPPPTPPSSVPQVKEPEKILSVTLDKNQNAQVKETPPAVVESSPTLDLETFLESQQTELTVETELPVKDTGRNHSADSGFISQDAIDDSTSSSSSSSDTSGSDQTDSEQTSSDSSSEQSSSEQSSSEASVAEKAPIEKIVIVCDSGKFRHADKNERRKSESGAISPKIAPAGAISPKIAGAISPKIAPPKDIVKPLKVALVKKDSSKPAKVSPPVKDTICQSHKLKDVGRIFSRKVTPLKDVSSKPPKLALEDASKTKTSEKQVSSSQKNIIPDKRLLLTTAKKPSETKRKKPEPKSVPERKKQRVEPAKTISEMLHKDIVRLDGDSSSSKINIKAPKKKSTGDNVVSSVAPSIAATKDSTTSGKPERTPLFEQFTEDLHMFQAPKEGVSDQREGPTAANKDKNCNGVADCNKLLPGADVMIVDGDESKSGQCAVPVGNVSKAAAKEAGGEHGPVSTKDSHCAVADKCPVDPSEVEDHSQQIRRTSPGGTLLSPAASQRVNMAAADSSASVVDPAAAAADTESPPCSCPSPSKVTSSVISDSQDKRQSPVCSSPMTLALGKPLCASTPAAASDKKREAPAKKKSSQPTANVAKTNGEVLAKDYSSKQPESRPLAKLAKLQPAPRVPIILKQNTNTQLLKSRDLKSKPRGRHRSSTGHSQPAMSPAPAPAPAPSPIPFEPPTKRSRVMPNGYPAGAYHHQQQNYLYPATNFYHGAHHMGLPATLYGTGVAVPHHGMGPMGPMSPLSPGAHGYYFNTHSGYPPFYNSAPPAPTSMPNGYDAPLELTTNRKEPPREAHRRDNDKSKGKGKEPERTLLRVPSLVRP